MKIERDILFTSECSQPSDRHLLSLPGGKIEMLGCSLMFKRSHSIENYQFKIRLYNKLIIINRGLSVHLNNILFLSALILTIFDRKYVG